jgi:hypothetical protein
VKIAIVGTGAKRKSEIDVINGSIARVGSEARLRLMVHPGVRPRLSA